MTTAYMATEPEIENEMVRAACAHLTRTDLTFARAWLGVAPEDIAGPPVGLLVGEMPGENTSDRLPMFPYPAGSAAGRLLRLSGMTPGMYLGRFWRRNLFTSYDPRWNSVAAKTKAEEVREWTRKVDGSIRVILLGTKVAAAFGIPMWGRASETTPTNNLVEYATIPHPSGRNPIYNQEKAKQAAQLAMMWAGGFV